MIQLKSTLPAGGAATPDALRLIEVDPAAIEMIVHDIDPNRPDTTRGSVLYLRNGVTTNVAELPDEIKALMSA